ncbi:uncharacterized protein LOC142784480 isoform X3 [Rhipicephalus microplus]|uniref:uncharacterized protein LOC142784480 isoform X3 n=1 Tax=Rhipicephalus microplus TaxID=6941 RepID=UPI003F6A69AB
MAPPPPAMEATRCCSRPTQREGRRGEKDWPVRGESRGLPPGLQDWHHHCSSPGLGLRSNWKVMPSAPGALRRLVLSRAAPSSCIPMGSSHSSRTYADTHLG